MQPPTATLFVNRNYFAQSPFISDKLSRMQAVLIANCVDDFVLMHDAPGVEVLPASVLGTLGIANSYAHQRLGEFVVIIAFFDVTEDFNSGVKHRRKGLHARGAKVSLL